LADSQELIHSKSDPNKHFMGIIYFNYDNFPPSVFDVAVVVVVVVVLVAI